MVIGLNNGRWHLFSSEFYCGSVGVMGCGLFSVVVVG